MKRLLIVLVLALVVGLVGVSRVVSAPSYSVDEVKLCELPDYLANLEANGATVVSITGASSYETANETFCACGIESKVEVHCFDAPGWHAWTVYVVSRN
jgi:hypothetical protein